MKISEIIYNKKNFKPVKGLLGGSSGYDADEVDEFLDELVSNVERMEKEYDNLQIQVRNLMEEQRIEERIEDVQGQEEVATLKEKLTRALEQVEFLERANKNMFVEAEKVSHKLKTEAERDAENIRTEAREQGNSYLKKVEERVAEREREIQRLEGEEKKLRETITNFVKVAQNVVNN